MTHPYRAPAERSTFAASRSWLAKLSWVAFLLAAVPPLLIARAVAEFGLDVPIQDQWGFAREIVLYLRGEYPLSRLFFPVGQHRVVMPKLVMLPMATLTHWDVRAEMWFNFGTVLATLALLTSLARRTLRPLWPTTWMWTVPLMSVALFSLAAWQSWTWGWMMAAYLNALATVLVAWALERYRLRAAGVLLVLVGSLAAGMSFISGMALAGLVPLAMALLPADVPRRERATRVAAVAAVLLGAIALYIATYPRFMRAQTATSLEFRPLDLVLFTVRYVGAPLAAPDLDAATWWGVAGLVVVASSGVLVWWRAPELRASVLPWLLLAAYVCATGAVTGVGRLGKGPSLAVHSRYITVSALFWASMPAFVVLGAHAAGFAHASRWIRSLTMALGAVGLALAASSYYATWERGMGGIIGRYRATLESAACLREQENPSLACLRGISHDPKLVRNMSVDLRALRIGPFRNSRDTAAP